MIYTAKRPPPLTDLDTPRVKLQASTTPNLKILSSRVLPNSGTHSRAGQTPTGSPKALKNQARSCQVSPLNRVQATTPRIEQLMKKSLKRFKKEKKELQKNKEFALKWKENHKEKLKNYNIQTRLDNKKFKIKSFRPRTALASPERKEIFLETEKVCKRKTGYSKTERRANIGLEFYHFKISRNSTPRLLQQAKQAEPKSEGKKKSLDIFIKKKKKDRKKLEKEKKALKNQAEIKRLAQLVNLEKATKKALRKSLKGRPPRPKFSKPNQKSPFKPSNVNIEKISITNSQDREVHVIIENGNFSASGNSNRAGRECMIFKNFSSQFSSKEEPPGPGELLKRPKSLDLISSSSTPIIELRTISNDSSSEKPEVVKVLPRKPEKSHLTENGLNIDIGLHKVSEFLLMKLSKIFHLVKDFDKAVVETPQLSEFPIFQTPSPEKSSRKIPLDAILSQMGKFNKHFSREQSEDLEIIWDKIEFNSKTDVFLNDPDPLPPLTPIEDYQLKQSKQGSKRPSEEISGSITDQLKKVIFPSIEYLSFGNIGEVSHEDVIDSPSLMSIASHDSEEPSEDFITFGPPNAALLIANFQSEPAKPVIVFANKVNPILIEDGSGSLSEYVGMIKENSSIATPEAEEVEEFSSIHFEFNIRKPADTSLNPFSISEETLVLDEEEIVEKAVNLLIIFVYQEILDDAAYQEFKKKNYQLLGNAAVILHEVLVRTGSNSVLVFFEKVWEKVDFDVLSKRMMDWQTHYFTLGTIQGRQLSALPILTEEVLKASEAPSDSSFSLSISESPNEYIKLHNKMIFDVINSHLQDFKSLYNPSPWQSGAFLINPIDFSKIFNTLQKSLRKTSSISAGRIPSIALIGNDGKLDEEMLQKVREAGLASILASEIEENEKKWIDYCSEEAQVTFDVADFILADLLLELEAFIQSNPL